MSRHSSHYSRSLFFLSLAIHFNSFLNIPWCSGAYAQVWKVIDRDTEEEWAMKVIFKNRAFSQKRLDQEVEALKRAVHPSIICLHEFISDENHLYLRQDLSVKLHLQQFMSRHFFFPLKHHLFLFFFSFLF